MNIIESMAPSRFFDNDPLYFGTDLDAEIKYDSINDQLVFTPPGRGINFDKTITVADGTDHSIGIDGVRCVVDDYGTLVSGQTYRAAYFRYNHRATTPGNPACEVIGVQGSVGAYAADEAISFRGGYFTTYVNADATSTMRTNIGCEISARASYNGGTECVAENGTAFVGARIWMAPYFTSGSIGNINNFHALWIINEAPSKIITNAIKIDASTYQGGFNYAIYADDGKAYFSLDGSTGSSFAAGGSVTTSGDTLLYVVGDDYRTLTASQEYKGAYIRYNVRSTTPGNPVCEITGVHGAVASYIADEAMTFRGGYFTTYVNADATSTMRTNVGCEVSARASYNGGTECVAENGTAFVGLRIWMAPWFTDGSITNINNFHGLWILNEAAGKMITHAIKIDSATYNTAFQYSIYADDGLFYLNLDGSATGSSLVAGKTSTASGTTIMHVVAEDYRTLTASQEYKGAYIRYNVRSTTPGNPVCEVTGVHGAVGCYVADEAMTFRGGYFTTYVNADATSTMRTNIGCEISARASYNGGTECVAENGTAFVGARIWMAPYFSDATIGNINNSHALWIINEVPNASWAKYIENAIKIDTATYGAAFNYCFNADSGKFNLAINGANAGSGAVAGERVTTSGDTWLSVVVDDYRTLTSSQEYKAGLFRYNIRSTTPGAPQDEITGAEGVVGVYVADGNLHSIRGGHFRTYINADNTSSVKTNIGCEASARASYSGGTECVALAGTAFTGLRIYMAPYFTSGSVGNCNNFWGLWIYGEHSSQRNADASIFVNDAGGGYVDGIRISATLSGYGIDLNGATITTGSMRLDNGMVINNDKADRTMIGAVVGIGNDSAPADNAPANGMIIFTDGTDLKIKRADGQTATLSNGGFS